MIRKPRTARVVSTRSLTTQTLSVLGTLNTDPTREWYGLELSKRSGLQPGTIYPILERLLKLGWLERRWEEVDPVTAGRPRRRLYRLTGVGETSARLALDEHIAALQRTSTADRPAPKAAPGLA